VERLTGCVERRQPGSLRLFSATAYAACCGVAPKRLTLSSPELQVRAVHWKRSWITCNSWIDKHRLTCAHGLLYNVGCYTLLSFAIYIFQYLRDNQAISLKSDVRSFRPLATRTLTLCCCTQQAMKRIYIGSKFYLGIALLVSFTALSRASPCVGGGLPCGSGCTLPGGRCIDGECYDSFGMWNLCLPSIGAPDASWSAFRSFPILRGWAFPKPGEFCDMTTHKCHPDTCPNQFKYGCSGDRSKLYKVTCPDSTFTECYESGSRQFRCYRGPGVSEISCRVRGSGSVSSSVSSFGNGAVGSTWGSAQAGVF
jgi:hypothetical protein